MTIEDLKDAKLSEASRGYLAIYLKLSRLHGEVSNVTELSYDGPQVDVVNEDFTAALVKAQEEVMKLAADSIARRICHPENTTEL